MPGIIRAFSGRTARLRFRHSLWSEIFAELRDRGAGRRESGAFLLTPRESDGRTVTGVVYYDDLDPDCLTGGISFRGNAYGRLWSICDARNLRVAGDAHTHPGRGVSQSSVDQQNPMVARAGHIALIVPSFANGRIRPADLGVHEYRGSEGWRSAYGDTAARLVYVGKWP
jgi:hypothetical protein